MWNFKRKKCVILLSLYTLCMVFIFYLFKNKLTVHKYESCTLQSGDLVAEEHNFSKRVNAFLKVFFKNYTFKKSEVIYSHKWELVVKSVYAYSAYFEKCPSFLSSQFCVKFVSLVLSNESLTLPFKSDIKCAMKSDLIVNEEYATIQLLPESHKKLFTAAYLFCPVPQSIHPSHASLYIKFSNLTWKPVEKNSLSNSKKRYINAFQSGYNTLKNISLCVRPFYNSFDFLQLSEFLAYYSVMGVDHFIFYFLDSFKPLHTFLNYMNFSNLSNEVFVWNIPLDNNLVHEYGQIAFTQDCLSRSKGRFTHTIIVDLDEYIVPNFHKNIKTLVSYLDDENALAGSFVIPSALFCMEYASNISDVESFRILNHRKRQRTTWYHKFRSKYILRPDRVAYSGVHFAWKFEENYQEIFVSPDVALLNHYRFCCGVGQTYFLHLFQFTVLSDFVLTDNLLAGHKTELLNHHLLKFISSIV